MNILPRHATMFDTVYAAVRDSICDGELKGGERITQENIAERLGVSRQPVGQALLILKTQGFVKNAGRRGLIVAPLEAADVRNIYEIRGALDGLAASSAARRPARSALKKADRLVEAGRTAVANEASPAELVKADMAFHEFIYELAGNPLIRESLSAHWHQLRRVMAEVVAAREYLETIWREHSEIIDAIRCGDGERAAALSTQHVERASQALQTSLKARRKGTSRTYVAMA